MHSNPYRTIPALLLFVFALPASAIPLTHTVDGTDNLYFTDWGHGYLDALDGVSDGNAASAVESGGLAFDFAGGTLVEVATGLVIDAGTSATDADGQPGLFRNLPVYSLIGVWSSTSTTITAIGSAFFIGTSSTFAAPTSGPAYLFLGENDGIFSDNSGAYEVSIEFTRVPEPASITLLGAALLGVGASRRRR